MAKKKTFSRDIVIKIDKNSYTIKYPTIGQLMQIESMKMLYSGQNYGAMVRTRTKSSERILDLIDTVSFLSVLIPDLNDSLVSGAKSISDLDPQAAQPFVEVYKKDIQPWMEHWDKILSEPTEKEEKDEEEGSNVD